MNDYIRQTAVKIRINNLTSGKYIAKEGMEPSYVLFKNIKVSRVNVMGVVVGKNQNEATGNSSIIVDDGSGRISVRSFEHFDPIDAVSVGDVILLIGRPREYGNEIYVAPEIIKKLGDRRWIEVRKLELDLLDKELGVVAVSEAHAEKDEKIGFAEKTTVEESAVQERPNGNDELEESSGELGDAERIINLIKNLDVGNGADIEKVISQSNIEDCNRIVSELLKNGDIFELMPGKLKVLE